MKTSNGSLIDFSEMPGSEFNSIQAYHAINKVSDILVYLRNTFQDDINYPLIFLVILLEDMSSGSIRGIQKTPGTSVSKISAMTGIAVEDVHSIAELLESYDILSFELDGSYHVQGVDRISSIDLTELELLMKNASFEERC